MRVDSRNALVSILVLPVDRLLAYVFTAWSRTSRSKRKLAAALQASAFLRVQTSDSTKDSIEIKLPSPGPVVITTGRGCVSPRGLMNANLCGSIGLYCISGHVWPLQPSSLTRGRPPHPPRPLLPRPKPRWRRGAKRLDGSDARTGGFHHRQRLCQPSGLDECKSVWIDLCVLHE